MYLEPFSGPPQQQPLAIVLLLEILELSQQERKADV